MLIGIYSTERASHPVGTTVKVVELFKTLPVRHQEASKHAAKWLAKIRRLMKAYALARPTIRFQLRVLKARSEKYNFNYAPKSGANVEDAAFKVVGTNCASQCEWTSLKSEGHELYAFLPKSDAARTKIANEGTFLSVDSRPVTSKHGTMKKVTKILKDALRRANPDLAATQDPFLCINIKCPPDSYDPNIEPAKDDVLFCDEGTVLKAVECLAKAFYPEMMTRPQSQLSSLASTEPLGDIPSHFNPQQLHDSSQIESGREPLTSRSSNSHWRPNMYGIDEEDMRLLSENQPPIVDEEEDERRAPDISNPWAIAKMNASMKHRKPARTLHLLTPAKGPCDVIKESPPLRQTPEPVQALKVQIPTPKMVSHHSNLPTYISDDIEAGVRQSFTTQAKPSILKFTRKHLNNEGLRDSDTHRFFNRPQFRDPTTSTPSSPGVRLRGSQPGGEFPVNVSSVNPPLDIDAYDQSPSSQTQHRQPPQRKNTNALPARAADDFWLTKSQSGAPTSRFRRAQRKSAKSPPFHIQSYQSSRGIRPNVLHAADGITDRLPAKSNTDIRQFLGVNRNMAHHISPVGHLQDSFNATNGIQKNRAVGGHPLRPPLHGTSRPDSIPDIAEQLRAYAEREAPYFEPEGGQVIHKRPSSAPNHQSDTIGSGREYERDSSPTPGPSSRPVRRRTAEGLHRTRSTQLLLARASQAPGVQGAMLGLSFEISQVRTYLRKLDMTQNSPEWGYPAEEEFNAFDLPVSEEQLIEWTVKIANALDELFERVEGVDVEGDIVEGMIKVVKGMCEEDDEMLMI